MTGHYLVMFREIYYKLLIYYILLSPQCSGEEQYLGARFISKEQFPGW